MSFGQQTNYFDNTEQTVTISDLGKTDIADLKQGPYAVNYDNNVDAACFATYAYSKDRKIGKENHFNWECRLTGKGGSKMLCALKMTSNPETIDPEHADYNTRIGAFIEFVRK
ncbi:hypothetical protein WDW86_08640 [Bdellovibrionota bacterium FG-2]